jgi:hypothetical protein
MFCNNMFKCNRNQNQISRKYLSKIEKNFKLLKYQMNKAKLIHDKALINDFSAVFLH